MTHSRDEEISHDEIAQSQSQSQHEWEHIPNDEPENVSPESGLLPSNTAHDSSESQPKLDQDRHISDHAAATPKKEAEVRWQEVSATAPRLKRRRFLGEWWQEMLSALLSVFCLVFMIVILSKVNGSPLEDWDEPVSLNAVVSVLSTAGKASMILPVAECISQLKWIYLQGNSKSNLGQLQTFDSASRGPSGSLQFFFHARGVPPTSYLACVIIMLALALDPFTQQIIRYHQFFETPVPNLHSTVRHSHEYDRGAWWGASHAYAGMNNDVLSGMLSGLYGNLPTPPFSCPGVNCTYPDVTSLGVSSTCEDVTERTTTVCEPGNGTSSDDGDTMVIACNFTLPGGSELTASSKKFTTGAFDYPTLKCISEPALDWVTVSDPIKANTTFPKLYSFDFVRFRTFESTGGSLTTNPGTEWVDTMTAYECVFELSAHSFANWSHVDGRLQEGSVAQSNLLFPFDGKKRVYETTTELFVLETIDAGFPGNQTLSITPRERTAIMETFAVILGCEGEAVNANTYLENSLYLVDPDIPRTFDAMSRGITYNMMDGPNATISQGQVYKTQTFITVRWEWIILSIVTVTGSLALLAATIVKTCTMNQRAWKSSLAPLLYADVTHGGGEDWDHGDEARRKATISAGVSAVSGIGAGTVSSK